MRILSIILLTLTFSFAISAKSITWKLNNLQKIGGHKTEILGNPKLIKDGIEFDGIDDGIFLDTNPIEGFSTFTIEAVFRPDADGAKEQRWFHIEQYPAAEVRALMETRLVGNEWFLDTFLKSGDNRLPLYAENFKHPLGKWYHVALVYDGKTMKHYVDGNLELSGEINFKPIGKGKISFGVRQNKVYWFKGAIKKARFTNKVLLSEKFMKK